MATTLLIDDNPLQVLPKLAEKIGLNEAIVLQQLHYWLNKSENRRDGVKWVYNSYPGWKEQFQFWSIPTIQRIFRRLENLGLTKAGNFNKMKGDLTKWYTIDYAGVEALENSGLIREKASYQNDTPSYQIDVMVISKCDDASYQNDMTITRDYTETTTETNTTPLPPKNKPIQKPLVVEPKQEMLKRIRTLISGPSNQIISGATSSRLHQIVDDYPLDWVQAGFEITADAGRELRYLIAILDHWKNHSFKCECRNPKSIEPIPIQKRQQNQQPYMSEYGVPYADITHALNYPKEGTYGKDFIFRAKEA